MTGKIYHRDKNNLSSSKKIWSKNTFKVALLYLFDVVILLNTNFNFKLKIDSKTCTFKNLEEISQKPVATLILKQCKKYNWYI